MKEKVMDPKKQIQLERRTTILREVRIAEAKEDTNEGAAIEGYAAVFDVWSEELGGHFPFREKVAKGAFTDSINEDDIRALFNHDPNYILGRNRAGTLTLTEDDKGLLVRIVPPNNTVGADLMESIRRGDITQMSFGFTVVLDRWSFEDEVDVRELLKVKLYDVSPVTYPAYDQTECVVRSAADVYRTRQEEQQDEVNKSRRQAEKQAELQMKKKKFDLMKESQS
jgi:hypothetical protein